MKNLFIAIAGMALALSPVATYAHCGTCGKGEAKAEAAKCEKCTDDKKCEKCEKKAADKAAKKEASGDSASAKACCPKA